MRQATTPKPVKYPSLEYVLKLTRSIEIKTEIDRRDQALISFLIVSGMRDKAISTMPLGCFDREDLVINQLQSQGANTKFGKSIVSNFFKFDDELVQYVVNWAIYLEKEKLFASTDPLFPRSKAEQIKDGYSFIYQDVEPEFWKGTGSIRAILKTRSQNAGLEYYHPHSFRQVAVHLAIKKAKTIEQMKEKAKQGIWPHQPPLGYINNKSARTIEIDSDKAQLVKRLFELYSTGEYSLLSVRNKIDAEGLKSRTGTLLPKSRVESILRNPFYCGEFIWKGNRYSGIHTPIITRELFTKVQHVLRGKGKSKGTKGKFAFTGLLKCNKCGCLITAEIKKNKYI